MNLLLDTHIWIWYLEGNPKISQNLKSALEDDNNQLFISPISIWEILILSEKKKIQLNPTPIIWINQGIQTLGLQEAPLTIEIAVLSRQLDLVHQDPSDRFIAATTVYYNLILATADTNLTQASCLQTLN